MKIRKLLLATLFLACILSFIACGGPIPSYRITSVSPVQLRNAELPNQVRDFIESLPRRDVQLLNALASMAEIPSVKLISERLWQLLKAPIDIASRLSGSTAFFKEVQLAKEYMPISVTPSGIITSVMEIQPEKTLLGTFVIPSGSVTEVTSTPLQYKFAPPKSGFP